MTEYVEDAELNGALRAIISNVSYAEFSPIRDAQLKIIPFLKVKTNKEGEHQPCKGIPAQAKKVSDLHRAAGIDADYLLVVDYYAWNHPKGINPQVTMDAMLHHALKAIKIEVKEGKPKFGKNDPDVEIYIDTVNRYPQAGAFAEEIRTVSDMVAHAPPQASALASGELDETPSTEEQPAPPQSRRKK
jgi:hypothetical protein